MLLYGLHIIYVQWAYLGFLLLCKQNEFITHRHDARCTSARDVLINRVIYYKMAAVAVRKCGEGNVSLVGRTPFAKKAEC